MARKGRSKNTTNQQKNQHRPISLEDKVELQGGSNGYALEMFNSKKKFREAPSTIKRSRTPRDAYGRPKRNRCQSASATNTTDGKSEVPRGSIRSFDKKHLSSAASRNNTNNINNINIATPAYLDQSTAKEATAAATATKTPYNPYKTKPNLPPSSAKFTRQQHHHKSPSSSLLSTHIICSISENLARETCITTMDATSPTTIEIHKMANGQTYIETLSYLEMIHPHEILLNEGRRNSQLCRKIVSLMNASSGPMTSGGDDDESMVLNSTTDTGRKKKGRQRGSNNNKIGLQTPAMRKTTTAAFTPKSNNKGECKIQTIVKFLPRSNFDQTRGAELLERVAHDASYDPSIINEYIVLSSSYSLVSYVQSCLGSNFNRNSLKISMNWGGKYRMAIDRNTISHLELLANAKTGKNKNSLIGTIDCAKTNVGSRLLRSNLISPPTGIATINARLDLVDSFLDDEAFFYEVLEQLQALPDIDKMMAHIALVPNNQRVTKAKRGGGIDGGKKRQVTARMASRGISALVCIKSILSVVPNFARVLEIQLKSLEKKTKSQQNSKVSKDGGGTASDGEQDSTHEAEDNNTQSKKRFKIGDDDIDTDNNDEYIDESNTVPSKRNSEDDDSSIDDDDNNKENDSLWSKDSKHMDTSKDDCENENESKTIFTNNSSLLIGLGGGGGSIPDPDGGNGSHYHHQLLRAILTTMKQPALKDILDSVLEIFTESTTYSRNSHAMKHQECFALKPNTDGMMDVLRKAFLANVDDIYKLADEYAETHGFTVVVKETTARGYYLSIPVAQVGPNLPDIFIQPVKSGKFYNCTTEEVKSLF